MKENATGVGSVSFDKEETPFRGFFSKTAVKKQLKRYLPDVFSQSSNSISDGLFSNKEDVYVRFANIQQLGYSFKHCQFAGVTYPLTELTIHHALSTQMHSEELVVPHNRLLESLGISEQTSNANTKFLYGGWSVHMQLSCPHSNQNESKRLQITWSGKEQWSISDELEVAYKDMDGNGQIMVIRPKDQTLELQHLRQIIEFSDTDHLANLQMNQPLTFDRIALSSSLISIAFHGNEMNKVGNQEWVLPVAISAKYP